MTFTKRSERQSIGKKTAVDHQDIIGDVEWKVSAKQGPDDPAERNTWLATVRKAFKSTGFETRMYYRNLSGGSLSGEVHQALSGATDLVMCPRELISLNKVPRDWYDKFDDEIVDKLIDLTNADELWERGK